MKKKALTRYTKPKYPDKTLYGSHPELLFSSVPARWLKNKALIGALTALTLGGIRVDATGQETAASQITQEKDQIKKAAEETKKIVIAPIFIHGDGVGATGCVVISPPAFLSEAEAMDIILSEFKKAGIEFDEIGYQPADLFINQTIINKNYKLDKINNKLTLEKTTDKKQYPFVFDAFNRKLNFGLKFISRLNYFKVLKNLEESGISVTGYDFIAAAQDVRDSLQVYGKCQTAVFYDPLEDHIQSICAGKTVLKKADHTSTELLQMQVKDFLV